MFETPPTFVGLAAAAAVVAACASQPPPASAPVAEPTTLAQTLPLGGRATYTIVDSAYIEADGERVRFRTRVGYEAEVRMRFRTDGDDLVATASLSRLEGLLENPTTGTVATSLDDVDGDWVASIERDGTVVSLETPVLTDRFREVVGTEDLLRGLFVSLPDAPVTEGSQWVDTLRTRDVGAGVRRTTTIVARSRVAERATVAGRPVLILESVLDLDTRAETEPGATEPSAQTLRGTLRRRTTWDAGLRRLTHYRATGRLVGRLEVEGLEPIPLSADLVREVTAR
ncbi:MAG TPA: hypothetical protein VK837_01440 [Longimicrobiales bacterium]|nr:hypothetical protein [Longimicrobiales bacterium]